MSRAHDRRIQYSRLTQENLLGNPQFFNRLPVHNTSSDEEGYSSESEAPQIRENVRNHSAAHARRIQYSLLTQENLLGNPQFFNRLPAHNTSSDDEGYSSASEAPQNRNLY
jgi:hypothetical protein